MDDIENPLKAIQRKCVGCSHQLPEWCKEDLCPVQRCPLWPFRFGLLPSEASKQGKRVDTNVPIPYMEFVDD